MANKELVIDVDFKTDKAVAKQKILTAEFEKQKALVEQQKKLVESFAESYGKGYEESPYYQKANNDLAIMQGKLEQKGIAIKENTRKIEQEANAQDELKTKTAETTAETKTAGSSLEKFAKRIEGLVKRVFIFSLITKALRSLRSAIGDYISKDRELSSSLAKLKGNLIIIGNTIMEALKPAIQFILELAVQITSIFGQLLASVLGKDINKMKTLASETKEVADQSERALASFDTLQKIDTTSNASGTSNGGVSPDFTAIQSMTNDQLAMVGAVTGLAMVGLGIILCVTGANIPLGLFLILTGGVLVWNTVRQSDKFSKDMRSKLQDLFVFAGATLVAIGLILCLAGVSIPVGLALIGAGAGSLYAGYKIDEDELKNKVSGVIDNVYNYFYDNLIKQVSEDLDWLVNKDIPQLLDDLKAGDWSNVWIDLGNVAIDALNGIIDCLNFLLKGIDDFFNWNSSWLNPLLGLEPTHLHTEIPKFDRLLRRSNDSRSKNVGRHGGTRVPGLANGSVIPGGSPFLAMLGDQPKGQTNIEAPLETIVQAFKQVDNERPINISFSGSLAQLGRVLNPVVTREQKRASMK